MKLLIEDKCFNEYTTFFIEFREYAILSVLIVVSLRPDGYE